MQTMVPALVAMSAAMLMIQVGVAKRRLAWRRQKTKREKRRRP
jgi:hypothetical protein